MTKPKKLPLDKKTKEWLAKHPKLYMPELYIQCSVIQCKKCGLWYRPSLSHECEKERRIKGKENDSGRDSDTEYGV